MQKKKKRFSKATWLVDPMGITYRQLHKILRKLGYTLQVVSCNDSKIYLVKHPKWPRWSFTYRYGSDDSLAPDVAVYALGSEMSMENHGLIDTHQVFYWYQK